jgi:hypothetical protein
MNKDEKAIIKLQQDFKFFQKFVGIRSRKKIKRSEISKYKNNISYNIKRRKAYNIINFHVYKWNFSQWRANFSNLISFH